MRVCGSKFEPAELRSQRSRKSSAQDQDWGQGTEDWLPENPKSTQSKEEEFKIKAVASSALSTQSEFSSFLQDKIHPDQEDCSESKVQLFWLSSGGRVDPFLHTALFIIHHHPTKQHSAKLLKREVSPSRFHFKGCTDSPAWTASTGDLITAQNFNSFNYLYQKEFFLVINQLLSVPHYSSKSSPCASPA